MSEDDLLEQIDALSPEFKQQLAKYIDAAIENRLENHSFSVDADDVRHLDDRISDEVSNAISNLSFDVTVS